jgi:hypothetical protein
MVFLIKVENQVYTHKQKGGKARFKGIGKEASE